jgi:hypothetical protein
MSTGAIIDDDEKNRNTTSIGNNGDLNPSSRGVFDEHDERRKERERIKDFLNDVENELHNMLKEDQIKEDVHEAFQEFLIDETEGINKIISTKIKEAKNSVDIDSMRLDVSQSGLDAEGLSGTELAFKLGLWDRAKKIPGKVGQSIKNGLLCTIVGSLGRVGVPGMGAITEIKDGINSVRKK